MNSLSLVSENPIGLEASPKLKISYSFNLDFKYPSSCAVYGSQSSQTLINRLFGFASNCSMTHFNVDSPQFKEATKFLLLPMWACFVTLCNFELTYFIIIGEIFFFFFNLQNPKCIIPPFHLLI